MIRVSSFEEQALWKATAGATPEEMRSINYALSMYAANEKIDDNEYRLAMASVYRQGIVTPPLGYQ